MKATLKLEYLALMILGAFGFSQTDFSWWWFFGLFFLPDISMLGYLINTKVGAFLYNLFHHFGTAVLVFMIGVLINNPTMMMVGCVLFSHAAFDRIFGYGLKYSDSFQNTHLGKIGKVKK